MAQLVLGVAGAVIGGTFGMPQIGWAIGSAIGSAFAPAQKSEGPRLGAEKVPAAEFGAPLPILEGHPRATFRVLWQGVRQEIKTTTSQGKGGGSESSSFTYKRDVLLHLSDAEILGIRRIWSNGGLIWSIADDSDEETIEASEETTRWDAMRVYSGAADQLPDPAYEAVVGVGNAPAYRGRGTVFFEGLSLGSSGAMPILTFEVNAKVSEEAGVTMRILEGFATTDVKYTPPRTAVTSDVRMSTIHKNFLKTWSSSAPTLSVVPPIKADVRNPGRGNGDIPVMGFGFLGSSISLAGFVIAGADLELVVFLPELYQREWMGSEEIRFSTFSGKVAVGSTRPIGDVGEWNSYQGRVFLYTLTGDYVGHANTDAPVKSIALSNSTLWVLPDGGSSGIRSYEVGSGILIEGESIPLAPGTLHVIFVSESGELCCANKEESIYTYGVDGWVLDGTFNYSESGVKINLGTEDAIHSKQSNGTIYAVIPESATIISETYYDYWFQAGTWVGEASVRPSIMAAVTAQNYVFDRTWLGPDVVATRNARQYINNTTVYPDPDLYYSLDPIKPAYIISDSYVMTIIDTLMRWDEWRDNGDGQHILGVRQYISVPKTVNAHNVYAIGIDLSGVLIPANLQEVTERICYSTGLAPDDVDATELADDWVYAFNIPPGAAKSAIDQLATGYYFECVESDKLYFRKRGRDPVLTIPYDDLGAEGLLTIQDANDLEIPGQVFVKYMNLDDAYQQGSEQSDRLTTDSTAISNIELALGFKPAQAKGIADTACLDQQIGSRTFGFALDRRYIELEPTDVVLVEDGFGSTFRMRIAKISDAAGVRTIEAVADDASVLSATGITSNNYKPDYTVRPRALTDLVVLDMPILRDVDDGPGMYTAGDGLAGTWPGYALFIEGLQVDASTTGAAMGAATDVLGGWASGLVDEVNSVTVQLNPGDQITSITHAQLTSTILNYAAIGAHGRWELLQYRSAELIGTGLYRLRGLLRGQLGTEHLTGTHAAGDRFVQLDGAGMLRPVASIADIMTPRDYQGVTIGSLVSTAPVQSVTNAGVGMLPYAPVNLRQAHSGADIVMTWDRRTRYQTNLLTGVVPLGEAAEAYDIEIYSGATLKRTLTSATPTATYTSAQQVADFGATQASVSTRIYQRSATVGRGTPLIFEA